MSTQKTLILSADEDGLAHAAGLLGAGRLVAFPTETVYGLGADARNGRAVAGIFAAKNRPRFNPLIVHVPDMETARSLAHWSDTAEALARAFWPGPLSLVLPLRSGHGLSGLVTAGLETVALRLPAHPLARDLLGRFGPVAAPSANPSGRISPTQAAHVTEAMEGRIAAVVDGGPATVGLESTIVAAGPPARLLRPGGIASETIEACLGTALETRTDDAVSAPGQLQSHYAPRAQVRLNASAPEPGEVMLGFGPVAGTINLSETGNLTEAAANLFRALHELDATGQPIAAAPIPEAGLGRAINDRLRRAAAPRSDHGD